MKKFKVVILLSISLLFALLGFIFYSIFSLFGYSILFYTISVVCLIVGVHAFVYNRTPDSIYNHTVKSILNTFDSILVRSSSVPNLEGRNIVMVMSIDDLVDAQFEIRKPICYLKQTESCSFVLLDDKEAYVYIEKLRDDVLTPVEIAINELKLQNKKQVDIDSEMLQDIERTTVVKLSNQKSYKVSPIRKQQKDKVCIEDTQSIESLTLNEEDITQVLDVVEESLSNTQVLFDDEIEII